MSKPTHPNNVEFEVYGDYALFSDPITRIGGENVPIKSQPMRQSKGF